MSETAQQPADRLARILELGLILAVIVVPLPLASVGPRGRLLLELIALTLAATWCVRALKYATPLPPRPVALGIAGLLLLGVVQTAALPAAAVHLLSPRSVTLRSESQPTGAALQAERRLLDRDPATLTARPTLSVDPSSTASALRTGAALAALLLVATTVAATCGVRRLALGLLASASFQALYGVLVLASGHARIWHLPKEHFLDAATGTFVNTNHFAVFLAMALPCGVALVIDNARRRCRSSNEVSRNLLLVILLVLALAGLLASFSRAGILLGLGGLTVAVVSTARHRALRTRMVVILIILGVASLPLLQIGSDKLVDTYAQTADDVSAGAGRAQVWSDTISMALRFPFSGTGLGTFSMVYPLFRSPEVRLFYRHAHSEPLQLAAEAGLVGLVLAAMILVPLLRSVIAAIAGRYDRISVGIALGLLAVLLHTLIDFDFRIPANAATAAILAGSLLGMAWRHRS